MEKKKEFLPYIICICFVFAVSIIYLIRLFDWQIFQGASMLVQADHSSRFPVPMAAARGEILDKDGNPLAVNKTGYAIVCDALYMSDKEKEVGTLTRNHTILTVLELLKKNGETWEDSLPILVDSAGNYSFLPDSEKEIETLKSTDYAKVNSYATAAECMAALTEKYGAPSYSPQITRDLISVRYGMTRAGFSPTRPYTLASDVSLNTVSVVRENTALLPGLSGQVTTAREYPVPELLPHTLGYLGALSQTDYEALKDKGYSYDDRKGQSGIELAFEEELRGTNGEKVVETSTTGEVENEYVQTAPVQGSTVFLTLDSNLQAVGNASLAKNIAATRANGEQLVKLKKTDGHGEDCFVGGAAVIDLKTGGVLAAPTWPSYDQVRAMADKDYYASLKEDKNSPLLNHSFYGTFAPGSCFKPAVALGALEEGVITNDSIISCGGVYTRFSNVGYSPKCMGVHGNISLQTGLARSCNVFFFETGYRLGIESVNLYCGQLGLGQKTGLEVAESAGVLAGPKHSTALGSQWNYSGGTIQAAIGQSDNSFTPLQLAVYAGTIANDGTRLKSHLEQKITDYTRKTVEHFYDPTVMEKLTVSPENIKYVQEGMRAVIQDPRGNAHASFGNYAIPVAGKTGTAERSSSNVVRSDNVTFIAYAPYDDPQIAVAVVLERGATGSFCQAVAKDLMDAYFFDKTVNEKGELSMPSAGINSGSSTPSEIPAA